MKRFFWFFLLLFILLLSACAPGSSGAKCQGGVCVDIEVVGPVRASTPAPFTITVKTEKDITNLGVSLDIDSNVTVNDIEKSPTESKLNYKDKNLLSWTISTKGGQEYIISGHVIFNKPTVSYGISNYGLFVRVGNSTIRDVTNSLRVYLDAKGEQVDASKAKTEAQQTVIAPTPPPGLTVVPETAIPSITPPSSTTTPLPQVSPTIPAYPAPGGKASTEAVKKSQPLLTPTLAAYPNP